MKATSGPSTVALLIVLLVGVSLGWASRTLTEGVSADTLLQSLTIVVTVALAMFSYRATKAQEVAGRHFPEKAAIYEDLLQTMKELQMGQKAGEPVDQASLARDLLDLQYKAIIWGDHRLVELLMDIGSPASEGDLDTLFGRWAELYEQMRRELGHKDKPGVGWDVIMLNVIDSDRHMFREMKQRAISRRAQRPTSSATPGAAPRPTTS